MTHAKVRYRHLTDHRHRSPDTLHSLLLMILNQYFANLSRESPQRQLDLVRQTDIITRTRTHIIYIHIYGQAQRVPGG